MAEKEAAAVMSSRHLHPLQALKLHTRRTGTCGKVRGAEGVAAVACCPPPPPSACKEPWALLSAGLRATSGGAGRAHVW